MGSSGVKNDALFSYGTNSNTANRSLGQISPLLATELTGSDGYTPTQLSDLYTGAAQSSGGGQAAAVGAGNLFAARDNNAGGFGASIADAARMAGDRNASTALQIQNQNTGLENQRQQSALSQLSDLYTSSDQQANSYLNTANQAARPFWQQMLLGGIQAAGAAAPTIGRAAGLEG
ncbi:hypothetical protein [Terriglobus aquaticus]|uniref:Uncharacterized protein n=1 Tax=Terriglobus aquaticus TaxID=940139 RepID=A0ABW9KIL6_9BACT|nr:hypothetical protein [Terriglobus aquaticus]